MGVHTLTALCRADGNTCAYFCVIDISECPNISEHILYAKSLCESISGKGMAQIMPDKVCDVAIT